MREEVERERGAWGEERRRGERDTDLEESGSSTKRDKCAHVGQMDAWFPVSESWAGKSTGETGKQQLFSEGGRGVVCSYTSDFCALPMLLHFSRLKSCLVSGRFCSF